MRPGRLRGPARLRRSRAPPCSVAFLFVFDPVRQGVWLLPKRNDRLESIASGGVAGQANEVKRAQGFALCQRTADRVDQHKVVDLGTDLVGAGCLAEHASAPLDVLTLNRGAGENQGMIGNRDVN